MCQCKDSPNSFARVAIQILWWAVRAGWNLARDCARIRCRVLRSRGVIAPAGKAYNIITSDVRRKNLCGCVL